MPRLASAVALASSLALVLCACNPLRNAPGQPTPALLPTRTLAPAATQPTPSATLEAPIGPSAPKATATTLGPDSCAAVKPILSAATSAQAGAPGRIAFIGTTGDVGMVNPDGSGTAFVTTDGTLGAATPNVRTYLYPTFSNDGRHLAFVRLDAQRGGGLSQTVLTAPAEPRAKLTDVYATADDNIPYLDWSPDDTTVAFLTINPREGAMRASHRDGKTPDILITGAPMYWHWRGDSAQVIAHAGGSAQANRSAELAVVDAKTGRSRAIEAAPGEFQSPHYAPSGKHMLYVADAGVGNSLVLADADGKPVCAATSLSQGAFFAWSPDGQRVAFVDVAPPLDGSSPLEVLNVASGARVQLRPEALAFFWSPNGKRLAVYSIATVNAPTQLGAASAKLNQAVRPSRETGDMQSDVETFQSPTAALRIEVFDADSGDNFIVADTLPTRDFTQLIGFFDQYSRAITPWSPDSNQLVFTSFDPRAQTPRVVVATLSASSATNLKSVADGTVAFWSPR